MCYLRWRHRHGLSHQRSVNSRPSLHGSLIFHYRLGIRRLNVGQIRPIDISTHRWKFLSVVRLGQKIPKFCILGLASIIVTVTKLQRVQKNVGPPILEKWKCFLHDMWRFFLYFLTNWSKLIICSMASWQSPTKRFEILTLLITVTPNGKLIALNYNHGLNLRI